MRILTILALSALVALVATAAAASIPEIPDPDAGGIDARQLIGFRTCRVLEVRTDRVVVLYDEGDGQRHVVELPEDLKLRAQAKRDFDGRRKLTFADLAAGQRVKVNYLKSDGNLVGIDVLKAAR